MLAALAVPSIPWLATLTPYGSYARYARCSLRSRPMVPMLAMLAPYGSYARCARDPIDPMLATLAYGNSVMRPLISDSIPALVDGILRELHWSAEGRSELGEHDYDGHITDESGE